MESNLVQSSKRSVRFSFVLTLFGLLLTVNACQGQNQHTKNQQKGEQFTKADFQSLNWLAGKWCGSGGKQPFHEIYSFVNDTTLEIDYFGQDSTWTNSLGKGSVYFSDGFIYHRYYEGGLWAATTLDSTSIKFIPLENASTKFSWVYESTEAWVATLNFPDSNGEMIEKVYRMER